LDRRVVRYLLRLPAIALVPLTSSSRAGDGGRNCRMNGQRPKTPLAEIREVGQEKALEPAPGGEFCRMKE